jgi:hypothetical protein
MGDEAKDIGANVEKVVRHGESHADDTDVERVSGGTGSRAAGSPAPFQPNGEPPPLASTSEDGVQRGPGPGTGA